MQKKTAEQFIKDAIADDSDYFAELANTSMDYIKSNSKELESAKGNGKKIYSICQAALDGELEDGMAENCTSVMTALCLAAGCDYDAVDNYLQKLDPNMYKYMCSMFR